MALTCTLSTPQGLYLASQEAKEDVSARTQPKAKSIAPGSRVSLREGAFDSSRQQHLLAHVRRGDLGTVVEGRRAAWPGWVHVRFDDCSMTHRLTEDEISLKPLAKR